MKYPYLRLPYIILLGISLLLPAYGVQAEEKSAEATLKNVDAVQAMAIANQWKWSKPKIRSYVDSKEVVFELSNGRVKRIPLPEEKMIVAVAPYVRRTHR
jgi:hypothetical protein